MESDFFFVEIRFKKFGFSQKTTTAQKLIPYDKNHPIRSLLYLMNNVLIFTLLCFHTVVVFGLGPNFLFKFILFFWGE